MYIYIYILFHDMGCERYHGHVPETYVYMHAHACTHAYIAILYVMVCGFQPTYIHTYIHACMHACMRTHIHTCMEQKNLYHTYKHTYKHSNIHTYIHAYIYTHKHA